MAKFGGQISSENFVIPRHIAYFILLVFVATLIVAIITLVRVQDLPGATSNRIIERLTGVSSNQAVPQGMTVSQFLEKLTNHKEAIAYQTVQPINILVINANNLQTLETQIRGLNSSYIGDYIIQYQDRIFIYNLESDVIKAAIAFQQSSKVPNDLFTKLLAHPEMTGVENQNLTGGILDQASLATLKQQLPEVYKDAQVGDYLLRYEDRLVIYNYNQDQIINLIPLQKE